MENNKNLQKSVLGGAMDDIITHPLKRRKQPDRSSPGKLFCSPGFALLFLTPHSFFFCLVGFRHQNSFFGYRRKDHSLNKSFTMLNTHYCIKHFLDYHCPVTMTKHEFSAHKSNLLSMIKYSFWWLCFGEKHAD